MIKAVNPIYDAAFKFLMQDEKVARILLGAILGKKVTSAVITNNEYIHIVEKNLTYLKIDFAARIKTKQGEEELATIELQKAFVTDDMMRFRTYLAQQYSSDVNQKTIISQNSKGQDVERKVPLHIYAIYILGYGIGDYHYPVLKGKSVFRTIEGKAIKNHQENEFLNALTHDTIVVQIPYLRKNVKTRVERMLSIFDQDLIIDKDNPRFVGFSDEQVDEMGTDFLRMVSRLNMGTLDAETMRNINEVERVRNHYNSLKEQLAEQKEQLAEQKEQLAEQKEQLAEQKGKLAEKEEQLAKQKKQLAQKDEALNASIKLLASMGIPVPDIAKKLNVDVAIVEEAMGNVISRDGESTEDRHRTLEV